MQASVAIVVVAAGPGTRLGANCPKAFVELAGRPLLAHTIGSIGTAIRAAAPPLSVGGIVVVAPPSHTRQAEALVFDLPVPLRRVVAGGEQRQDSVRAGLNACGDADVVLIHDAARPFVTAATVVAVAEAASEHGAAIAALPAVDTVKIVGADGRVTSTPERTAVWLAQTPQGFRRQLLLEAHAAAPDSGSTDDASLVEACGIAVRVVAGDPAARKITTPDDLRWAEWMLHSGQWPR